MEAGQEMKRFEDVYPKHPRNSFIYMASPFRSYAPNLYAAYDFARMAQGALWRAGVNVFSPIACFYPTATWEGVDQTDHDWWMKHDAPYMRSAIACIVLKIDGWDTSKGVKEEIEFFEKRNSNIYSLEYPVDLQP